MFANIDRDIKQNRKMNFHDDFIFTVIESCRWTVKSDEEKLMGKLNTLKFIKFSNCHQYEYEVLKTNLLEN